MDYADNRLWQKDLAGNLRPLTFDKPGIDTPPYEVNFGGSRVRRLQRGHTCEILSQEIWPRSPYTYWIIPMQTLTTHEHWVFATLSRHTWEAFHKCIVFISVHVCTVVCLFYSFVLEPGVLDSVT